MMRAPMILLLGCLGWLVSLGMQKAQAGIFCHGSCCSLVAGPMAAPAAATLAVPAAVASAAAPVSAPAATLGYVAGSGIPVGPCLVVYGIPQGYLGGSAPPVSTEEVPLQNLLDAVQRINTVLGAAVQPATPIQSGASAIDPASLQQDIRNLQRDVAMLKIRCLSKQSGIPTSDTPAAQPATPPSEATSPGGANPDLARLAGQVQRLSDAMTEQNRRLDQLAADVQSLKAHPPTASGGAGNTSVPPAAR